MKQKFTMILILIASLIVVSGCSSNEDEYDISEFEIAEEASPSASPAILEENRFYVKHQDGTQEELYFGNATFDRFNIADYESDSRVMWFKEDFESIPTLYSGDKLIYYTTEVLNETFTYERFEDFGYSIGLCGLTATDSNRYMISTEVSEKCTYPGGDTDELLYLNNETVLLDKIGNDDVRKQDEVTSNQSYLSRVGSLEHLTKDSSYKVDIYEGTIKHEYIFKADVRVLGSMEVAKSSNFTFESDNVLSLEIPKYFNSGYYLVNGVGMFRYVAGDSYNENTNFNISNINDNDPLMGTVAYNNSDNPFANVENMQEESLVNALNQKSEFVIMEPGEITVYITFTIQNDVVGDGLPDVDAKIYSPSGHKRQMMSNNTGLYLTFDATETGTYTIEYENLDVRVPNVVVAAQ